MLSEREVTGGMRERAGETEGIQWFLVVCVSGATESTPGLLFVWTQGPVLGMAGVVSTEEARIGFRMAEPETTTQSQYLSAFQFRDGTVQTCTVQRCDRESQRPSSQMSPFALT